MLDTQTNEGVPELFYSNSNAFNQNNPLGWSESLFIVALHEMNQKFLEPEQTKQSEFDKSLQQAYQ